MRRKLLEARKLKRTMSRNQRVVLTGMVVLIVGALLIPSITLAPAFAQAWQPTEPTPGERDWIKMTSGEWLWGDIKGLRDDDFEFDSEELDLLKLDFDDVAEVRSARILTYRFESGGVFTGTATIRDGVVKIQAYLMESLGDRRRLEQVLRAIVREPWLPALATGSAGGGPVCRYGCPPDHLRPIALTHG